jgi:hypothetical protein
MAVPKDIQNVRDEVNELQRRLTQAEQHNRLMRESINEIGQYLLSRTSSMNGPNMQ